MTVPRVELEDVEALIPMTVGPQGRISGLTDYVGRRIIVVVPADEKTPRKTRGTKGD